MLCRLEPQTLRWRAATEAVEQFLGQNLDQLRQRSFLEFLHPDDRALAEDEFRQALELGERHDFVLRFPNPTGQMRYVRVYTQARYNPDGTINHIRGYLKDVTERVQAEQELRERTEQLIAANEHLRLRTEQLTADNMHLRLLNDRLREFGTDTDLEREQLSHYQVLQVIGEGGMGLVYKAMHTVLRRIVAMKVLSDRRREDPDAIRRFRREMEVVGKLDHPNIVQGFDAGESDGLLFLIMDYVEGIDLSRLVTLRGPLPVPVACEMIRQAAVGLQHVHEHGLVHRDLKPSNLMLTWAGQVKVLDLGLARLYSADLSSEEITHTGQVLGTADYMAPEQARDTRIVDIRSDLYSLGCTLFKLLTGRAPFSGPEYQTVIQKLMAHAEIPAPPITRYRPEVPEPLANLLSRLLAKDPEDRFDTPAQVARAIEPFATGCNWQEFLSQPGSGLRELSDPVTTGQDSTPCPTESFRPSPVQGVHQTSRASWVRAGEGQHDCINGAK
jgi:PAS domain S-box-containing protein